MLKEVIEILNPRPGQNFIDCTLGGGSYAKVILEKIKPDGKILAIDLDELAIKNVELNLKLQIQNHKLYLAHDNFKNLQKITEKYFAPSGGFDGIVFDLGLSSAQLKDRTRGFSFNLPNAPLAMNFGGQIKQTAEQIINYWSALDLTRIFKNYGEEKFAHKIALAIIRQRQIKKINTVGRLAEIVSLAVPRRFQRVKLHPATKIFQALRLAVNSELENLQAALPQARELLKTGGKIVVISYHSLEDRMVKQYFKKESKDCHCPPALPLCRCGHKASLKILTQPILRPTEEEVLRNPRSRSAKLRAAERM